MSGSQEKLALHNGQILDVLSILQRDQVGLPALPVARRSPWPLGARRHSGSDGFEPQLCRQSCKHTLPCPELPSDHRRATKPQGRRHQRREAPRQWLPWLKAPQKCQVLHSGLTPVPKANQLAYRGQRGSVIQDLHSQRRSSLSLGAVIISVVHRAPSREAEKHWG